MVSIDFRLPNITATTTQEQVRQLHSYLFQITEQLNWAFNTLETSNFDNASTDIKIENGEKMSDKEVETTFNSIKSLIIKSADIVKAYEETIRKDFNGEYVAQSEFGTYTETTQLSIDANSKRVSEVYTNVQTIESDVAGIKKETDLTKAYINRGLLGYDENGKAIYGIEVGEYNESGEFIKYARFKSDRLSFFDANKTEVAYIGAGCLYILGKTAFDGDVQIGKYILDRSDGLAFAWVG